MATRGRPPALSRAAVLDGALSLLDDVGLDAFSMRALGTRLGADPMAVYHYFPSRTALLDGVVERIFAEVVPPDRTGDWAVDVTASTHAFRDAVLAHPAAIPLMAMRPAVTPDAFRITESLLEALAPAGLSARDALDVAQALGRLTMGHAIAQAGAPPGADQDGREQAHAESAAALPADRFPHLARAYADGYEIDHDALFARAVEATLTGVPRAARPTTPREP